MRKGVSPEDMASAMAVQDEQRRLGVRVSSIEELVGLVDRPIRKPQNSYFPLKAAVSNGSKAVYGIPTTTNCVPFFDRDRGSLLGKTMEANFCIAQAAVRELRSRLKAEGATPARAGLCVHAFLEIAAAVPNESTKSAMTAAELASILGTGKTPIGEAVATLEKAGIIRRVKEGRTLAIHVNPRFVYRGRSAMFGKVLAEFEALGTAPADEV